MSKEVYLEQHRKRMKWLSSIPPELLFDGMYKIVSRRLSKKCYVCRQELSAERKSVFAEATMGNWRYWTETGIYTYHCMSNIHAFIHGRIESQERLYRIKNETSISEQMLREILRGVENE